MLGTEVLVFEVLGSESVKRPLKKKTKNWFSRMIIASILQYFLSSLSYHLSLTPLFCLFLSDRLRQVLLFLHQWLLFCLCRRVIKFKPVKVGN